MDKLRVRVRLNKGKKGIPLNRMANVSGEIGKFLDLFCKDLSIKTNMKNWLATNFKEGSLIFTIESKTELNGGKEREFNSTFEGLISQKNVKEKLSEATRLQFAKITSFAEPEDSVEFGLPSNGDVEPDEWHEITTEKTSEIVSGVEATLKEYGAIQGTLQTWFKESTDAHFTLRELSTRTLIKCYYKQEDYEKVYSLFKMKNAVIYIGGAIALNIADKKIENIRVDRFDIADNFTDEDFNKFFGCAPNLTGEMSTSEYLRTIRENAH